MAMIKCPECGQEISDKAKKCIHCGKVFVGEDIVKAKIKCNECGMLLTETDEICPNCGCPVEKNVEQQTSNNSTRKQKKNIAKIVAIVMVSVVIIAAIIGGIIYSEKVVKPKKIEAQNKATYEEAIDLLEKGKYSEGNELLYTISGYKDVDTILEQIKWESRVYECIIDFKQYLKNPDSLQIYEVAFYDGYKSNVDETKQSAIEDIIKLAGGKPICVMREGAQNGFGGNTTGYTLFLYSESDGAYKYMGSCNSLDEDEIDEDETQQIAICSLINIYKDSLEQVGNVDLARLKTIVKNDSYSTIKIIE